MKHILIGATLAGMLFLSSLTHADTVFPARLEMKEVEAGLFEVRFTLPIVNGRRVRAEPVLPQVCTEVGEARIVRTARDYSEYHVVRCQRDSLFGKVIAVRDLVSSYNSYAETCQVSVSHPATPLAFPACRQSRISINAGHRADADDGSSDSHSGLPRYTAKGACSVGTHVPPWIRSRSFSPPEQLDQTPLQHLGFLCADSHADTR